MVATEAERAALQRAWDANDVDGETLVPDARGTLARPPDGRDAVAAGGLPPVRWGAHALFETGDVIGSGSMGVVRLGRQPALAREVAVKELAPDAPAEAVAALVREARVAGRLEHPNIVPIHALCANEDGGPLLVMKHIDGTSWADVLADPAVERTYGAGGDRLEWHIDVLLQLCRAVEYAHSRSVLHLDLKPANVMVGAYGEVYLLDWGVAAALDDDGPATLPRAREIRWVCGTPGYMAPEAAAGDGRRIGIATDVYLLGAILHEILTGRPRHGGERLVDCLASAHTSAPPDYDATVPPGLAAICRRAMAREPSERYADVAAFRQALLDHRAHRESERLVAAARRRVETALAAVDDPRERGDAAGVALERAWAQCRFGLENARESWPDNPGVPETLQVVLESLVARALREGRLDRAAAWMAELPQPVPVLVERLAERRAERARAEERRLALERLGRETDLNAQRVARVRFAVLGALVWFLWNVGSGYAFRVGLVPFDHATLLLGGGVTLALLGATAWVFRNSLLTTGIDRRGFALFGAGIGSAVLAWLFSWAIGMTPLASVRHTFVYYVFFGIAVSVSVDRRLLLPTLLLAPFGGLVLLLPAWTFELLGAAGAVFALLSAWIWRRPLRAGRPAS